jgi:hypothetical protein
VYKRRLIGFCCVAAVLVFSLAGQAASAEAPPAVKSGNAPQKPAKPAVSSAEANPTTPQLDSQFLVREVVYNELHDHDSHGYWRYWVESHSGNETVLKQAIETPRGQVARLEASNGRPPAQEAREEDDRRLHRLLTSPSEQAQHFKDYQDDEHRIGRILALLPGAFLFELPQPQARSSEMPECPCYHMRFHPNPDYPAHSIEARIFHAMAGDLWVSVDNKRLVRLDGKLQDNVDFGFGILGRLYKDGWFRLERTHVVSTANGGVGYGDWKTQRLEVHMTGRAMLFKTISRETSEIRSGFAPVPPGLSLQQAAALVHQSVNAPDTQPVALATAR